LQWLQRKDEVQSITFELCGKKVPHLVKYDFELALMPLFITYTNGSISPVLESDALSNSCSTALPLLVPSSDWSAEELKKRLLQYTADALAFNEEFRQKNGLKKVNFL
jgi:hypothetical protein